MLGSTSVFPVFVRPSRLPPFTVALVPALAPMSKLLVTFRQFHPDKLYG